MMDKKEDGYKMGSSDGHANLAAQLAEQVDAEDGQQPQDLRSDGNHSSILSANSARISQSAEQAQAKSEKASSNNQQDLK